MPVILDRRQLASSFRNMNIVKNSRITHTHDQHLVIIGEVGLDKFGRLTRRVAIPLHRSKWKDYTSAIDKYCNQVTHLIYQLEDAYDWVTNQFEFGPKEDNVTQAVWNSEVPDEESPYLIHCSRRGKEVYFFIYGHNVNAFSIGVNMGARSYLIDFQNRINEIINHFKTHLEEVGSVKLTELFKEEVV